MFEVGQEVICIKSHSKKVVVKGRAYTVSDLTSCKCESNALDVGVRDIELAHLYCVNCHHYYGFTDVQWVSNSLFIPLDMITEIEVLSEVKTITLPNVEELALIGQ